MYLFGGWVLGGGDLPKCTKGKNGPKPHSEPGLSDYNYLLELTPHFNWTFK